MSILADIERADVTQAESTGGEGMMQPAKLTKADVIFGVADQIHKLLPDYDSLPEDFRRERDPWCSFVHRWFFEGVKDEELVAKAGVNKTEALMHCSAIMRSFRPKHEHKIRGVAWLLSQWFERPTQPESEEPR